MSVSKIILTSLACFFYCYPHIVYFIPPKGYNGDKIFDMSDPFYNKDDQNRPFFNLREHLRKQGYDLVTTNLDTELKDFSGLIVCDLPLVEKLEKCKSLPLDKKILLILEPPTVAPEYYDPLYHQYFGKILIMIDDYVNNTQYFKLHYPQANLCMLENPIPFVQKKFCTLIAGNKYSPHACELYSERKKIIRFFENFAQTEFDLFGFFWQKDQFPSYRGPAAVKQNILKNYKFCICYENMRDVNGYITEKIFDVFKAGCIPVYWGAQNITDYIPNTCFIDRRAFDSDSALYNHLHSITQEEYERMLTAIRQFFTSPRAFYFSDTYFINQISIMLGIPVNHAPNESRGS